MMNKSKIDWCDFSWNPITGCRHGCEYCYAAKQARRFSGDLRSNFNNPQLEFDNVHNIFILKQPFKNKNGGIVPFPAGFEPTLHKYRLTMPEQKKKSANIFVGSMADLFGEWVPDEWIEMVFAACEKAPQHNYLFLTKNPQRYIDLAKVGKLPSNNNIWYGSTVTKQNAPFFYSENHNTFISIEPMLENLGEYLGNSEYFPDWVIIGAETGNRHGKVIPKKSWITKVTEVSRKMEKPIFMKENLAPIMGTDKLMREYPDRLRHIECAPIPHCHQCGHCTQTDDGKRGKKYYCNFDDNSIKHIPGRYTRTSPPWCMMRKE